MSEAAVTLTKDETIRLQAEEIERLRAEIRKTNIAAEDAVFKRDAECAAYKRACEGYVEALAGQDAELRGLRGLLRESADAERDHYATQVSVLMKSGWYKRVREALGE